MTSGCPPGRSSRRPCYQNPTVPGERGARSLSPRGCPRPGSSARSASGVPPGAGSGPTVTTRRCRRCTLACRPRPRTSPERRSATRRSAHGRARPGAVRRGDAGRVCSGGGRPDRSSRWEASMGLLDGKKALIFGVANDHSIAWGIAQALHAEGAIVGFSSVESLIDRRVRPLAERLGSTFVEPCDVQDDAQIRAVFERWRARPGRASTSSSMRSPSPSARTSTARSSTRRATGSRWPSTSRRTRSWRSCARPGRSSTAGRRCSP